MLLLCFVLTRTPCCFPPVDFQAMCVENECVLQLSSNPLFTPVPVMEARTPLRDCVLSVSQFTGAERESLVELAKHLGAKYGPGA